jgi:hypothetical protein
MWADRNRYESNEERKAITAELRGRQAALLAACGRALGREALPDKISQVARRGSSCKVRSVGEHELEVTDDPPGR